MMTYHSSVDQYVSFILQAYVWAAGSRKRCQRPKCAPIADPVSSHSCIFPCEIVVGEGTAKLCCGHNFSRTLGFVIGFFGSVEDLLLPLSTPEAEITKSQIKEKCPFGSHE